MNGGSIPTIEIFTYLGSTVMHDGRAGSDIRNRLNKFRDGLRMLNNVRKPSQYRTKTKIRRTGAVWKGCSILWNLVSYYNN